MKAIAIWILLGIFVWISLDKMETVELAGEILTDTFRVLVAGDLVAWIILLAGFGLIYILGRDKQ